MTSIELTIDVTQSDIDHGVVGNCGKCPVAIAMLRAANHLGDIQVRAGLDLLICLDGKKFKVKVPRIVNQFMDDFDSGEYVKPFSFSAKFRYAPLLK